MLGEINTTTTGLCNPCPSGKYSLDLSDESCHVCMTGANCNGGSNITVLPGYWRANSTSSHVISCPQDTCLGGAAESECTYGFTGPLCMQCDYSVNYALSSSGKCKVCPNFAGNVGTLAGITILTVSYNIFFLFITISYNIAFYHKLQDTKAGGSSTKIGTIVNSLLHYLQLLTIIFSLNEYSLPNLQAANYLGNPFQLLYFSSDCAFLSSGFGIVKMTEWKIVITTLTPLGYWLVSSLALQVVRKIKPKKFKNVKKRQLMMTAFVCILMTQQPAIIRNLIEFLNCQQA